MMAFGGFKANNFFFLQQTHITRSQKEQGYVYLKMSFGAPPVHADHSPQGVCAPEESWVGGAFPKKDYHKFPGENTYG